MAGLNGPPDASIPLRSAARAANGPCARDAPTVRSSWAWNAATYWICCRTARPRRWQSGCEAMAGRGACAAAAFTARSRHARRHATGAADPVIALVVLWRLRYKLSLRDLPEMFAVRGIVFSHEAVREWEAKLVWGLLCQALRHCRFSGLDA